MIRYVIVIRLVWTTPCDPRSAKVIVIKNAITMKINDQVCSHDQASVDDTICNKKGECDWTSISRVCHVSTRSLPSGENDMSCDVYGMMSGIGLFGLIG